MMKFHAIFLFIVIMSLTGCSSDNRNNSAASIYLSLIKYDLELWHLIDDNIDDLALKRTLADSISAKLLTARFLNAEIREMNRESLEVLCLLHVNNHIFDHLSVEPLREKSTTYLSDVHFDVLVEIKKSQKNMLGSGCLFGPRSESHPYQILNQAAPLNKDNLI